MKRLPNHSIERIWDFLYKKKKHSSVNWCYDNDGELEGFSILSKGSLLYVYRSIEKSILDEDGDVVDIIYSYRMTQNNATAWCRHKFVVPILKQLKQIL